jgi:hypothetical protein
MLAQPRVSGDRDVHDGLGGTPQDLVLRCGQRRRVDLHDRHHQQVGCFPTACELRSRRGSDRALHLPRHEAIVAKDAAPPVGQERVIVATGEMERALAAADVENRRDRRPQVRNDILGMAPEPDRVIRALEQRRVRCVDVSLEIPPAVEVGDRIHRERRPVRHALCDPRGQGLPAGDVTLEAVKHLVREYQVQRRHELDVLLRPHLLASRQDADTTNQRIPHRRRVRVRGAVLS